MEENQTTAPEQQMEQPASQPQPQEEQSWIAGLPTDLQANDSLKKFSSVESLAKSYINAESMIGADKMVKPNKNFTEEDWNNFYTAAGRPDEAANYEVQYETDAPEVLDGFKNKAHTLGLNNQQAQGILDFYTSLEQQAQTNIEQQVQQQNHESELKLRQELGQQFDSKVMAAKQAAATFASEEILNLELMDGSRIGDHPQILRMFIGIADKMGEDIIRTESDASVQSNDQIDKEIAELTMPGTAYWNKTHPDHDRIVNRVLDLRGKRSSSDPAISVQPAMGG